MSDRKYTVMSCLFCGRAFSSYWLEMSCSVHFSEQCSQSCWEGKGSIQLPFIWQQRYASFNRRATHFYGCWLLEALMTLSHVTSVLIHDNMTMVNLQMLILNAGEIAVKHLEGASSYFFFAKKMYAVSPLAWKKKQYEYVLAASLAELGTNQCSKINTASTSCSCWNSVYLLFLGMCGTKQCLARPDPSSLWQWLCLKCLLKDKYSKRKLPR